MVSTALRHKRSHIALPLPTPRAETPTHPARWSGDSLAPSDGYSSLFTSGLMRDATAPSTPQIKCRPSRAPLVPAAPSAFRTSTSPSKSFLSPSKTPNPRRRRSSILASDKASPAKNKSHGTPSQAVESALDNVMRNLRLFTRESRDSRMPESRWSDSSSSEDQDDARPSMESGKPRKSLESVRSRLTVKSKRSIRSLASFRTRKSEDGDRMEVDAWQDPQDVPPVPAVPAVSALTVTPGRGRRALEGLAKKLGLTPKKSKRSLPPPEVPDFTAAEEPLPPLLPLPRPSETVDRSVPRKSSLSTLRSLGKKSSTGTLRSIRTIATSTSPVPTHPFLTGLGGTVTDCETPPLPTCIPTTPKRAKKSSIGHPKARPTISPSTFLHSVPRRAPSTPKAGHEDLEMEEGETITFGTATPDLSMDSYASCTPNTSFASFATPCSGSTASFASLSPAEATNAGSESRGDDHRENGAWGGPLTAKSALVKAPKIVQLLPKSQRANLGLQTPSKGLRPSKSRENIRIPGNEGVKGASMPILKNGLPAAKTAYTPSANRTNPTRYPLAMLGINSSTASATPPLETPALPYRKGGRTAWNNTDGDYFGPSLGTFGLSDFSKDSSASHAVHIRGRPGVPDFSKPMDLDLDLDLHLEADRRPRKLKGKGSESIDSIGTIGTASTVSTGAVSSSVSMLGTCESGDEGWELEKYLRELEGDDGGSGSVSGPMVI